MRYVRGLKWLLAKARQNIQIERIMYDIQMYIAPRYLTLTPTLP